MTKIVYNACYGGFSLSDEAVEMYLDLKGLKYTKTKESWGYTSYDVDDIENFSIVTLIEKIRFSFRS